MIRGIDTATRLTAAQASAIKAEGYAFAGRYLVPEVGTLKWKALTKAEAEAITSAGLKLLTVWETTASRAKGGVAAGASDGVQALKCARELGMPTSGVIYFAVDYDAQSADYDAIEAYLKAAREQTAEYDIGVYGSFGVVEAMAQRKACTHFWQCVGWSNGKKSPALNVYQSMWSHPLCGISVDDNECADMDAAGIWDYEEENMDVKRFKELWHEMRAELQDNDASEYSAEAREWAVSSKLVSGGESGEFNGMWEDVMTREQLVTVLYRFAQLIGKA